jgi:hypothetical protein
LFERRDLRNKSEEAENSRTQHRNSRLVTADDFLKAMAR